MAWLEPEEEHFQDAMDELEDEGIQTIVAGQSRPKLTRQ